MAYCSCGVGCVIIGLLACISAGSAQLACAIRYQVVACPNDDSYTDLTMLNALAETNFFCYGGGGISGNGLFSSNCVEFAQNVSRVVGNGAQFTCTTGHNDNYLQMQGCSTDINLLLALVNSGTVAPSTPSPTTLAPSIAPSMTPTRRPTRYPTHDPTRLPTVEPSHTSPTLLPTTFPSMLPTESPSRIPTSMPSSAPSNSPTLLPTLPPVASPTVFPNRIADVVDEPNSSGSDASVIAIATGCGAGLLILLCAAYCVCRKRTQRNRKAAATQDALANPANSQVTYAVSGDVVYAVPTEGTDKYLAPVSMNPSYNPTDRYEVPVTMDPFYASAANDNYAKLGDGHQLYSVPMENGSMAYNVMQDLPAAYENDGVDNLEGGYAQAESSKVMPPSYVNADIKHAAATAAAHQTSNAYAKANDANVAVYDQPPNEASASCEDNNNSRDRKETVYTKPPTFSGIQIPTDDAEA